MGTCASSCMTTIGKLGGGTNWTSTAKVIHLDGRLQEFRHPIKAGHLLSQNPNSFLCSSEAMYIDSPVPRLLADEDLQLGQMYFLLPTSMSHAPLSLPDLCSLAIKASTALSNAGLRNARKPLLEETVSVLGEAGHQRSLRKLS
ncbi:hypothetical protein RJ639_045093 [Escallonia herrerae]|uniref:Uncharacterized protein n=1 Tax=Escallonia herrerae TaxID=1293975 RepID=A0AA88W627_9ASTE|nr:hypothetical protein RJ639_045093 [Escallonia herrerae]